MRSRGLGRHPHPDTPYAAQIYNIREHPDFKLSTRTYRYWWENGCWLDQGNTGTCVGNAFAHRIADGPVRHAGITETWARQLYLDASGDTTYEKGTSGILAARVLKTRGLIDQYLWVSTPDDLKNTILEVGTVCVGVDWLNSMDHVEYRYNNAYLPIDLTSGVRGGHEFELNGINLAPSLGKPFYRMKNSWSTSWAHSGTARLDCDMFDELLFKRSGDALVVREVVGVVA